MSHAIRVALALSLAIGVCSTLAAQQPQPVFKTATQFVSVDVVVTGKGDLPVTDLKKEDFDITENGKPQKVSEFSFVSIPVAHRAIDVDAPPQPPSDVATNGDSAHASRAIVILVDDPSLSAVMFCLDCPDVMIALKQALTRFLQSLSSDDQVALVWQSRSDISQDFTNDIPSLIASVNSRKKGMGLTAIGPTWRPSTFSLKHAVEALAGSKFARRAIVYVGVSICDPTAVLSNDNQEVECLDLYKKAREADVPIYALDPRVLPPLDTKKADTMAELAINTGGLHFLNQSNPLGAVDKIVADNGSFYTLGFYPEPLVNDGKYHEINVTVKRPDVRVRSRERYLADTATPASSTPTHDMTRSLSAGLDDPSLPVRVIAVPLGAGDRGTVRTLVTMAVAYPSKSTQDLSFDDELRVGILSLSTDGKVKASFQRPIQLKGKFRPGASGTFVINETIDLPAGQQVLRVGATSRALGRTGTAHLPIVVPEFRGSNLALSPIVLGVAGQLTDADAIVGLDRLRALVPFQPTTSRVFAPGDQLRVFLASTWGSPATAVGVDITVSGGSTPVTQRLTVPASTVAAGARQAKIDRVVPLEGLSPGNYVLSVSASVGKDKPVTRALPFVIRAPH
jgi:VWFA-related protein